MLTVTDCPSHLLDDQNPRVANAWVLVGLVLLCLFPRTVMAWRMDTMCVDGVHYV